MIRLSIVIVWWLRTSEVKQLEFRITCTNKNKLSNSLKKNLDSKTM